ncbi:MAG: hypothetical protein K5840_08325, partial [Eubacterium sp.]|nr:hypothetical protein [Eubacterium sp.]
MALLISGSQGISSSVYADEVTTQSSDGVATESGDSTDVSTPAATAKAVAKGATTSDEETDEEEITDTYVAATMVDYFSTQNRESNNIQAAIEAICPTNTYWTMEGWRWVQKTETDLSSSFYFCTGGSPGTQNTCDYGDATTGLANSSIAATDPTSFGISESYYSVNLFDSKATYNKSYLSNVAVQFKAENGYYVLDSSKYEYTLAQDSDGNWTLPYSSPANGGFWPFGKINYQNNYHFGM